ncbi:glycosyltransferase [Crocinitomicaceae bacterium]|nr:glycosyltransferase [Crocinitomicaceae bacterium]
MSLTLNILLWSLITPVIYTYVIYPFVTISLAKRVKEKDTTSSTLTPKVSILIAAHNEELVIESKIKSILLSNYPKEHIEILIGTDKCTDNTDEIIQRYTKSDITLKHVKFSKRSGKITIINSLIKDAIGEILILTDSNVIFTENTINALLKHFSDPKVGLVDSNMKNFGMKKTGISIPEKTYISVEGKLKYAEGKMWGSMMGPFGGCFAMRKNLYTKIPNNFLVDDFFLNMKVLENGYSCLNEPDAVVYEDVSNNLKAEFFRKTRISAGNFQNLSYFSNVLFKCNRLAFVFLSHKILRWLSPFLILLIGLTLCFTYEESILNLSLAIAYLILFGIVGLDLLLINLGLHFKPFRYLTHFISMNAALFIGFFKYLKGSKTSVWNRTERLQS